MLIRQEDFFDRLNTQVFLPILKRRLTFKQMHEIVNGIADIIFEITLTGNSVRFGKLGRFKCHIMPGGMRWNPQKKRKVKCPDRKKMTFYMSKPARRIFYGE